MGYPSIYRFCAISACLGPEAFLEIFCVPGFGVGLSHFSIDPMPLPFLGCLFMFLHLVPLAREKSQFTLFRAYLGQNPATVSRNTNLK